MYTKIITAKHLHNCRAPDDYERRHKAEIAALALLGIPVAVEKAGSVPARINNGRLVVDCNGCDNVCLVSDPSWPGRPVARCFECGAVHEAKLPRNRAAIERTLLARPMKNRNWRPGMSISALKAINLQHGLPPEKEQ